MPLIASVTSGILLVNQLNRQLDQSNSNSSAEAALCAMIDSSAMFELCEKFEKHAQIWWLQALLLESSLPDQTTEHLTYNTHMDNLLHHITAQNQDLEKRMARVEAHINELERHRADTSQHGDSSYVPALSNIVSMQHDFEKDLRASWVYRRTADRTENMSFTTSVARESAWSALSRCSLADISILSVVALPVLRSELYSGWKSLMTADAYHGSSLTVMMAAVDDTVTSGNNMIMADQKLNRRITPRTEEALSGSPLIAMDILLTSIFAAANVNKLDLLPGLPHELNNRHELQLLLNSLPPIGSPAVAKHYKRGLLRYREQSKLLKTWILSSYDGRIVPATGTCKLPNMAGIYQFLVVENPPELEAASAAHDHLQERHMLFHGTSFDRLFAILVEGLKICSLTPLQQHRAALGPGIYAVSEPNHARAYATRTQKGDSFNLFWNSRTDFRSSGVILGLEHAGDYTRRGDTSVTTDPSRIILRYIFIVPSGVDLPKASDIIPTMFTAFRDIEE